MILNCCVSGLVRLSLPCICSTFIVTRVLISMFVSIMLKRKMKKMKSTSSVEEFREEFSIPLSIGLQFVEEKYVNPMRVVPLRVNCSY